MISVLQLHPNSDNDRSTAATDAFVGQSFDVVLFGFPVGQRTLQYQSEVLETVVLVNPSEETAVSEVSHIRTKHCITQYHAEACVLFLFLIQNVHCSSFQSLFVLYKLPPALDQQKTPQ